MNSRPVTFFSDGLRLDGDLYVPDDAVPHRRYPAVITCSGYQGLKTIHPARFARALVPAGYVCLGFDYRGFGRSDGVRGRLVPQEQCLDVRSAISFLETVPEVDPDAISLVGWALGGGVVIAAAADDPRVRSVVGINAIGDGWRSLRYMHGDDSLQRLVEQVEVDRHERAVHGPSKLVAPFEIVPLDTVTNGYVDAELFPVPGFGSDVTLESADFLFRFRPAEVVDQIAPRPLLLIHGSENGLHSVDESRDLYARAGEPKQLVVLEGSGHTEWMFDTHPTFQHVAGLVREFIGDALGAGALR